MPVLGHAAVAAEVAGVEDHELGKHHGEAIRMDGVDPGSTVEIEVVGPGEEADEAGGFGSPDLEGEFEGGGREIDIVIADGDGAGADLGAGKEAGVEGGGIVADEGDGGSGGGEMAEEGFGEGVGGGEGVEPEDEDGGDGGGGGVGDGEGSEEGEAGDGKAADEDGELVRAEGGGVWEDLWVADTAERGRGGGDVEEEEEEEKEMEF